MGLVVRHNKPQAARAVADFHKMAEKRFPEVNENEKDRIVNLAIPKNTQKATQFGLSVINGEYTRLNSCVP